MWRMHRANNVRFVGWVATGCRSLFLDEHDVVFPDERSRRPRIRCQHFHSTMARASCRTRYRDDADGLQMAVALSLSLEDARVCQPNRTSADDWACQQCTLINTSKIRCSACSAPAPTRQCRGKTKVPRPTAPPNDDSSGDDCGGSCLAGMFDFAGEPRCKPSADEPLGGWGYTACCGCAYHFQCLARHLNPHGKTVESTSGEVPLELKCPQCRTSLSRSSTRMLGGHDKVPQDVQAQQELNEQESIDTEQIVRDRAARSLARVLCGRALVKCEDQMTELGFESFVVTDSVGQIEEVLAPTTEGCEVMLVVSWDGADAIRMALTDALPYLVGPIPRRVVRLIAHVRSCGNPSGGGEERSCDVLM